MKKGKNYSLNNKAKRKKLDFYETPYSMTESIIENLNIKLESNILEPSSGKGAISKVLKQKGYYNIIEGDLHTGQDFLTFDYNKKFDWVITNPPFSLAFEFIERSKEISDNILMLLPLNYLHGKKRYDKIYTDLSYGLKEIFVYTRYPLLGEELRQDGKYKTGMMVYAWYYFKRGFSEKPQINWIDNSKDIIKK